MTVDRAHLRKTLVEGWKPKQSVQIEVGVLAALLDELDEMHARLAESDHLQRLADELDAMTICCGCGVPTPDGKLCEPCAATFDADPELRRYLKEPS